MSEAEIGIPLDELARENEVTKRLVERLGELAATLKEGGAASRGELAEGVRLLGQYRRLHAGRLDRDLQPEARRVAMPGCFEHLDRILADHREEETEVQSVLDRLSGPEPTSGEARRAMGEALEAFAQKVYDHVNYENDYPLSCLVATLPDDASDRVEVQFQPTRAPLADLEGHIDRLLERPIGPAASGLTVHCAHAGCGRAASAAIEPSAGGSIRLRSPTGWSVRSGSPTVAGSGRIHTQVDYFCPEHAGAVSAERLGEARQAAWADDGGSPGTVSAGARGGADCCAPLASGAE